MKREDETKILQFITKVQADMKTEEHGKQLKLLFSNPIPYGVSILLIITIGLPFDLPVVAVSGCILMTIFFLCKVQFQKFWKEMSIIFSSNGEDLTNLSKFYLENEKKRLFLIAEYNNHVIGTIAVRETEREGTGKLWRMFVDPSCRRMGIGSKLMKELFCAVQHLEYSSLELRTHETNTMAIEFYSRHGFRERKKTVFAEVFPCKLHAILFQKQLKQVETGF
ncbi:uncharacterized protein LOC111709957 [Eurytemora carolleeae]|uniref:uncharacterized protein LOC111709957 n=1 Tax=Eurytemora carolleeae TaxID=1294199 RepID=UPI000C76542A|nr:uncharacterized protein LOC111709957 [Eurytemora carolleeae]|eukprot:XP_023339709.1 uncharacterized protein LOC111709957 [Eurytemora affinis]